jgi:hypothetical protein
MSQITQAKRRQEELFEEEMNDIHVKAVEDKIQLIQENMRHTERYKNRMFHKGDKFEGNIYDSSYIIWVPIIQQRVRPWFKRFKEKR